MEQVEPDDGDGGQDMGPVGDGAQAGVTEFETFDSHEEDAAGEEEDGGCEQEVAEADGAAVGVIPAVPQVDGGEGNEWEQQYQADHEVGQKHVLIEVVLERSVGGLFKDRNCEQVD